MRMRVLLLTRKREVQEGKSPLAAFVLILLSIIACIESSITEDVLKAFSDLCKTQKINSLSLDSLPPHGEPNLEDEDTPPKKHPRQSPSVEGPPEAILHPWEDLSLFP